MWLLVLYKLKSSSFNAADWCSVCLEIAVQQRNRTVVVAAAAVGRRPDKYSDIEWDTVRRSSVEIAADMVVVG